MSKARHPDFEKWTDETLKKALTRAPERSDSFRTTSDIEIERLYLPEGPDPGEYNDKLGFPGQYPYTRGVQPTMYRGRFWTMRQYAGFSSAKETNERYRYLLDQGQTGLSVAFDLPTQIGYDPDHELCYGEVGKVGVSIASLKDMEQLFDGIRLDAVSASMTINATAGILLAMYIAVGRKQGVSGTDLRGTVQNDILKEYATRGTYRFQVRPSLRLITDIFKYAEKELPRYNTISISGYHMREAGSTAVQEVAFTLANGIAYVEEAVKAKLDVDKFAGRLSFFFNCHNNFFEEIAKFRAARRLWANIMKERFRAKKEESMRLRFHTQTAGVSLTSQQYENNVVRVTLQALAAVLGGTQSLHTNSRDEALALPSEESVRIALRTQQIIAHESGVTDTIDPLGGSPFIEHLTDEIESKAREYIEKIDQRGGAVTAVETGYIQQEIQHSAYAYQKTVESGDQLIVGVNKFQVAETPPTGLLKIDNALREGRIKEIEQLKKDRDNNAVKKALSQLAKKAHTEENLMPCIITAVESYATIGEICGTLADVFGEYAGSYL
ncbi:methylmalonyl-CoA mutase [Planctomycetota bacterium]